MINQSINQLIGIYCSYLQWVTILFAVRYFPSARTRNYRETTIDGTPYFTWTISYSRRGRGRRQRTSWNFTGVEMCGNKWTRPDIAQSSHNALIHQRDDSTDENESHFHSRRTSSSPAVVSEWRFAFVVVFAAIGCVFAPVFRSGDGWLTCLGDFPPICVHEFRALDF